MRTSTYWNAYQKYISMYLVASLENNCDDMAHHIRLIRKVGDRLTAKIIRMEWEREVVQRSGEIE